jgi:steroid delta-isomerase-like uncharacterized protein
MRLAHELTAVWSAHDIARVVAFYADDYEGADVAEAHPQHGPLAVRRWMQDNLTAFPDLHLSIEHCVATADEVVVFWLARGTHLGKVMNIPATGRPIQMRGVALLVIRAGKIVRGFQVWDVAGMLRAIGLLPDL